MGIGGGIGAVMFDLDIASITAEPASPLYRAASRRNDGSTCWRTKVNAAVHRIISAYRMSPHAERRGQPRTGDWRSNQCSSGGISVLIKPAGTLTVLREPVKTKLVARKTQTGVMKPGVNFLAADKINFALI